MKKIIASVLAIAITFTAVHAQESPERKKDGVNRHDGHRKHHGRVMADLNLTEEQKAEFKTLNSEHRKQMAELKKQDNITVKESREKMEALRKDHHAKFEALLTPDQKARLEKKKEARKDKMRERGHEKMGERDKSRGERMKKELNLTAEQSAKLDASRKKMAEKMESIRNDKSLTEEQQKEKRKELRKEQMENMKSILTEEQLKKMKEGRKHRGRTKMDT
jgi:Spy/CpxP family protein refolding chaperone